MSEDEPTIFQSRIHLMCPCDRVLKHHCEAFKMDGGLFENCIYRKQQEKTDGEDTD